MGTHPIFESDFDCLTEMVTNRDEDEAPLVHQTDEAKRCSICDCCGSVAQLGSGYFDVRGWLLLFFVTMTAGAIAFSASFAIYFVRYQNIAGVVVSLESRLSTEALAPSADPLLFTFIRVDGSQYSENVTGWESYSPFVKTKVLTAPRAPLSQINIEKFGYDNIAFDEFELTISAFNGKFTKQIDLVKRANCSEIWFVREENVHVKNYIKCYNETATSHLEILL